jgi:hypothetical protein
VGEEVSDDNGPGPLQLVDPTLFPQPTLSWPVALGLQATLLSAWSRLSPIPLLMGGAQDSVGKFRAQLVVLLEALGAGEPEEFLGGVKDMRDEARDLLAAPDFATSVLANHPESLGYLQGTAPAQGWWSAATTWWGSYRQAILAFVEGWVQ